MKGKEGLEGREGVDIEGGVGREGGVGTVYNTTISLSLINSPNTRTFHGS